LLNYELLNANDNNPFCIVTISYDIENTYSIHDGIFGLIFKDNTTESNRDILIEPVGCVIELALEQKGKIYKCLSGITSCTLFGNISLKTCSGK